MGEQQENRARKDPVRKFIRQLLTATCLTAASAGAAHASTVTESTDFSNTFAGADALPGGATVVIGQVATPTTDVADYFKFSGLTPSAGFNVDFTTSANGFVGAAVFDSSGNSLGSGGFDLGSPGDIGGTVPGNGILVVETFFQEGGPYTVTLTNAVPEPATTTLSGLGMLLVGGLGWRRRQKR